MIHDESASFIERDVTISLIHESGTFCTIPVLSTVDQSHLTVSGNQLQRCTGLRYRVEIQIVTKRHGRRLWDAINFTNHSTSHNEKIIHSALSTLHRVVSSNHAHKSTSNQTKQSKSREGILSHHAMAWIEMQDLVSKRWLFYPSTKYYLLQQGEVILGSEPITKGE